MGITRVADVTRLDRIGIPTYQAIRPNARSLSVSQGKGITVIAAKVSAVMEGAELWHAERLPPPSRVARVAEIEAELGYDVFDLRHAERSLLNRGMRLDWLDARRMDGSGATFIPSEFVSMDARVARRWAPPVFYASSNGLASGNSFDEAALHATCELVERDGTARLRMLPSKAERVVDAETVDVPDACDLLERLARAGMRVTIYDARGPTELPCFEVLLRSEDHPFGFIGAGCHLDVGVALCRALTEAAQSRLAQIAGSRDDISGGFRRDLGTTTGNGSRPVPLAPAATVSFREFISLATDDISRDLDLVVDRVKAQAGMAPIVVDLTREDLRIPVARVIAPGLGFDHRPAERRGEGSRS
jgi:ribosomal protein S12 methylthiotransferase accessory factor